MQVKVVKKASIVSKPMLDTTKIEQLRAIVDATNDREQAILLYEKLMSILVCPLRRKFGLGN